MLSRHVLTTGKTLRLHSAHWVTRLLYFSMRFAFMSWRFWREEIGVEERGLGGEMNTAGRR